MKSQDLQLITDRKCPEREIGWDLKQAGLVKQVSLPMAKGLEQDGL